MAGESGRGKRWRGGEADFPEDYRKGRGIKSGKERGILGMGLSPGGRRIGEEEKPEDLSTDFTDEHGLTEGRFTRRRNERDEQQKGIAGRVRANYST